MQAKLMMAALAATLLAAHASAGAEPHHHAMPKEVHAFHEVLAPLWHAAPGPARSEHACAKADAMLAAAAAIQGQGADALKAALATFKQTCAAKGEVDKAFTGVHDAFHRLIEQPAH